MLTSFDALPDDARIWIFGAGEPLDADRTAILLREVDSWLELWAAHGTPLTSAREWRDGRFLVIGVDQSAAGASGCSIDALFRVFQRLQTALGTSLLGGGRVFWRDDTGSVRSADRALFARLLASGEIGDDTPVFDTTLTQAGAYRTGFERPLREAWHRELAPRQKA